GQPGDAAQRRLVVERRGEDFARFGEERLRLLAALQVVDLDDRADEALQVAARREARQAPVEHPAVLAVVPPQAILHREGLAGLDGLVEGLGTALDIVGMYGLLPAAPEVALRAAAGEFVP